MKSPLVERHIHRRVSAFIGGFLALIAGAVSAQPVSVTDDAGRAVRLERPAQRIVAIAPGLTELAFAAGAGDRLVGVARHSDFPPAARALPEVGDAVQIDFERILAARPDLVLAWRSGNRREDYERLAQFGMPVYVAEPRRLADIARTLRAIGTLAATAAAAGRAAEAFESGVRELRRRHAGAPRVRVFYVIWAKPPMTVNGAHLISDVITLCGGENVFADVAPLIPTVSLEAVIAARPQALLGGASAGGAQAFRREWGSTAPAPLSALPAHYIDPDLIQRQTPRVLEGARAVCAALEKVRTGRRAADERR